MKVEHPQDLHQSLTTSTSDDGMGLALDITGLHRMCQSDSLRSHMYVQVCVHI